MDFGALLHSDLKAPGPGAQCGKCTPAPCPWRQRLSTHITAGPTLQLPSTQPCSPVPLHRETDLPSPPPRLFLMARGRLQLRLFLIGYLNRENHSLRLQSNTVDRKEPAPAAPLRAASPSALGEQRRSRLWWQSHLGTSATGAVRGTHPKAVLPIANQRPRSGCPRVPTAEACENTQPRAI